MSLRSDIVSFWFLGYRGEIKTELQAPVIKATSTIVLSRTIAKLERAPRTTLHPHTQW